MLKLKPDNWVYAEMLELNSEMKILKMVYSQFNESEILKQLDTASVWQNIYLIIIPAEKYKSTYIWIPKNIKLESFTDELTNIPIC